MGDKFDIPVVHDCVPRGLKPWIFILFVFIIQFAGGVHLAADTDQSGLTGFSEQDILMGSYALMIGMSLNFAVMFRVKAHFQVRLQLLICGIVLLMAKLICATIDNVPILVATCFFAGWFKMQASFCCNNTILPWITPKTNMSVFFCYIYLIVEGSLQFSRISMIFWDWTAIQIIKTSMVGLMVILVFLLVGKDRTFKPATISDIDWLGSVLWCIMMFCYVFICVYGPAGHWWESTGVRTAVIAGMILLVINLWRAQYVHGAYISKTALKNINVIRSTLVYVLFFILLSPMWIFEHTDAKQILGFNEANNAIRNCDILVGIVAGCGFSYLTFGLRKWSVGLMTITAFVLTIIYLAYFIVFLNSPMDPKMLFIPLSARGAAAVIIAIVYITTIANSGMAYKIFPQGLAINSFVSRVMGITLGFTLIGTLFQWRLSENSESIAPCAASSTDALITSMKEIYFFLLIIAVVSVVSMSIVCCLDYTRKKKSTSAVSST